MKSSLITGISFGLTSGAITTMGLMVGLYSGTHSKLAVFGGIITIAVADAFSDALGMHIAEESKGMHTVRQIWTATIATFVTKFVFALSFIIPVLIFEFSKAVHVSIAWGLSVLAILSYRIAKSQGTRPWRAITEHLIIAIAVIIFTFFIGNWVSIVFEKTQM